LFCRVVQGARSSLPHPNIEVTAVQSIGVSLAESHARWHRTDPSGGRRARATADRIRVEDGKVVEHWSREIPADLDPA
jgi:predicted SnoaL-like aldol condensation-catalyzing enzyme